MIPIDAFIRERQPAWQELGALQRRLGGGGIRRATAGDVDRLAALTRAVSTDLALAARDYPGDRLVAQLTQLLVRGQPLLYRAPPVRLRDLGGFFAVGLPRLFRAHGRYILLAAGSLLVGAAGGWAAVALRPDLTQLVPTSVRAGLAAHHLGNPAALSGQLASPLSALIIQNNIRVALLAFALGLCAGIPTVLLLLVNGFQLGTLAEASHAAGMDAPFWALIVPHGVIELTVICTAAGAGLRLGDAWLRPGLERRGTSLAAAAGPAARLGAGAACLLVVAGLIEGFVTPSGLAVEGKLAVGAVSGLALYTWLLGSGRRGAPRPSRARLGNVVVDGPSEVPGRDLATEGIRPGVDSAAWGA
ncbi:MAG TPA: stage II sporulation protein M [Verrucomicrobiae bacterium]|nr:stage II sporulation protein M [Verrucomicrobiae bacterium]